MSTSVTQDVQLPHGRGPLLSVGPLRQPPVLLLVGMLLLRTVLLFAGDGIVYGIGRAAGSHLTWNDAVVWSDIFIVGVDVITVLLVAVAMKRAGSSIGALLRTKSPGRDIAWGLLMIVIIYVVFFVASYIGNLVAYQAAPPQSNSGFHPALWFGLWSLIVMPATVAVAEETLYRGYLQSILTARWGKVVGLIVMSVAFALQHLALTGFDTQAWIARFVTTFLAGIAFGLLATWMKRLWPLIIGHWVLDVIGLGLPVFFAAVGAH